MSDNQKVYRVWSHRDLTWLTELYTLEEVKDNFGFTEQELRRLEYSSGVVVSPFNNNYAAMKPRVPEGRVFNIICTTDHDKNTNHVSMDVAMEVIGLPEEKRIELRNSPCWVNGYSYGNFFIYEVLPGK